MKITKNTVKPFWEAKTVLITFRAKTLAKALLKVSLYLEEKGLDTEDVMSITNRLVDDITVEDGEEVSVSICI